MVPRLAWTSVLHAWAVLDLLVGDPHLPDFLLFQKLFWGAPFTPGGSEARGPPAPLRDLTAHEDQGLPDKSPETR